MHIADCNGVTCHVAASMLKHLVRHEARLGRTQLERLKGINDRLATFYAERPGYSRMAELRLANLTTAEGWSILHGPTVKSANTRALTPFLLELADEFFNSEEHFDLLVTRARRSLSRFYELIYDGDVFLDGTQLRELSRTTLRFGAAMQELPEIARVRGDLSWGNVPKTHYFQHVVELASLVNPKIVHVCTGESRIGATARVWSRSATGTYRRGVQRLVLAKRLVALMARLGAERVRVTVMEPR